MDLACDRVNWRLKKGKDCETKQDEAKCPAKSVFLPFSMISVHLILKILFFFFQMEFLLVFPFVSPTSGGFRLRPSGKV